VVAAVAVGGAPPNHAENPTLNMNVTPDALTSAVSGCSVFKDVLNTMSIGSNENRSLACKRKPAIAPYCTIPVVDSVVVDVVAVPLGDVNLLDPEPSPPVRPKVNRAVSPLAPVR
jgi:hypothetical protein